MKHQLKHNDAGFTLIEVMIAMLVFTVGVLGLAQLQLAAIQGNANAEGMTEAVVFGSDQIEQMLSWDYDDARLDPANDSADYTLSGTEYKADGHQADPGGRYDAYWAVKDGSPVTGSKTIDVTVIWQGKGGQKTLSLSAVKAS